MQTYLWPGPLFSGEMASQVPSTPERHYHAEPEAERIRRLQMTSPSHRRNRVHRQPMMNDPILQPQFVDPVPPQPVFDPSTVPSAPIPPQRRRNLRNPMVHPPALNSRHIAIRNRRALRNLEHNAEAQR